MTNATMIKIDGEKFGDAIGTALSEIESTDGELVLDFSGVHRLDPAAIEALRELADAADQKSVKVALRAVNVATYKVLKMVKLAPRFSIEN